MFTKKGTSVENAEFKIANRYSLLQDFSELLLEVLQREKMRWTWKLFFAELPNRLGFHGSDFEVGGSQEIPTALGF